jgi:hypothetical protein
MKCGLGGEGPALYLSEGEESQIAINFDGEWSGQSFLGLGDAKVADGVIVVDVRLFDKIDLANEIQFFLSSSLFLPIPVLYFLVFSRITGYRSRITLIIFPKPKELNMDSIVG